MSRYRRDRMGKRLEPGDGIPEDPADVARLEALRQARAEREAVRRERADAGARVLEWFRSEAEGVDDAKRAGNPR